MSLAPVKRRLGDVRRRMKGVRPRSETPFATHVPVLIALAARRPIRRVLEFGSGDFSTLLFLDRGAFPDVTEVTSYEDDPEWAQRVLDRAGDETRLRLEIVDSVPAAVPDVVDDYDLILVDDSVSTELRSRTIAAVAERRPRGVVAVHDFELPPYPSAASAFDRVEIIRSFNPQVGLAWFGDAVDRGELARVKATVEAHRRLPVTDVAGWTRALRT